MTPTRYGPLSRNALRLTRSAGVPMQNFEVYGSIRNVFDRKPPLDVTTYGAVSYNPLDYAGAIGRFYTVGVRYKFF